MKNTLTAVCLLTVAFTAALGACGPNTDSNGGVEPVAEALSGCYPVGSTLAEVTAAYMYQAPGYTTIVETVPQGAHVTLLKTCPTSAQSAEWYDVVNGAKQGWVRSDRLSLVSTPDAGHPAVDSGTPSGFVAMGPPSYSGSTWTASERTNDETFASLKNWNYGFDDSVGASGNYYPWYASGTFPYWGSSESPAHVMDYDLPGNVYQTSTGVNKGLLGTYSPQTFSSTGWGVSFYGHYGSKTVTTSSGTFTATYTSGALNSYGKIYFPTPGHSQFYVQIRAQMMGYNGSNNGAWNALWFLGQGNGDREIDLQETGICGQSPHVICSHLQSPQVTFADYSSSADLSAGYHIYGTELVNGTVNVYLDNVKVGSSNAGVAGPYFLLMNGSIAQKNVGFISPPTNYVDMAMHIMEVQVYQR
jgi:hypothetical protein